MNEIYDGVITKPELNEDTLAHYGIAKKVHKYIDKYLKNGKWIYRYKSKAQELGTKINRKLSGADADQISLNYGKEPIYGYAHDNGKATSRTGTRGNFQGRNGKDVMPASGHTDGLRVAQGTAAGRKRAGIQNKSTNRPKARKKTVVSGKVKVSKKPTRMSSSTTLSQTVTQRKRNKKVYRQSSSNSVRR